MSSHDRRHDHLIAERAALWVSRMPTANASMRREFVRWLKQSPVHVHEVLIASALDLELGSFDPQRRIDVDALFARAANNVTPLVPEKREAVEGAADVGTAPEVTLGINENDAATAPVPKLKSRGWKSSIWLSGAAAAAGILALALNWPGSNEDIGITDRYQTQTSEQRTIPLRDGSRIHLNTQTDVRVSFSDTQRDIFLDEGQASFDVAHDAARPFRVHAERVVVQAIGTQFDVNRQTDHTDVVVIEGRVKVTVESYIISGATQAASTDLVAGKGIRITADGSVSTPVDVSAGHVLAWRERRLVFRNDTLKHIAAEFNRYNKAPKIRVEGEGLQSKRFSGVFNANDPESFLQYLAVDQRLAFDRSTAETVVVRLRSSYALR